MPGKVRIRWQELKLQRAWDGKGLVVVQAQGRPTGCWNSEVVVSEGGHGGRGRGGAVEESPEMWQGVVRHQCAW